MDRKVKSKRADQLIILPMCRPVPLAAGRTFWQVHQKRAYPYGQQVTHHDSAGTELDEREPPSRKRMENVERAQPDSSYCSNVKPKDR